MIEGAHPKAKWPGAVLARRRGEREALLDLARGYVDTLPQSLGVAAVVVVGSVARGDFNVWSDVDVLVLARHLPERELDRLKLLVEVAPAGVQPVGWTPDEFRVELARGNPIAKEALQAGVVLRGSLRVGVEA
ncbi:MAG: nucleotidyltransferase domain-containing protein [Actinomycetota bacterium]